MRRLAILLLVLSILALPVAGAEATTFAVSTTEDSSIGTCVPGACTLRQAVEAANAASGPDAISLPTGTYSLVFGQLENSDDLTIAGGGADSVSIVSDGNSRVISNSSLGVSLRIEGVTISGGRVKGTSASQAHGGGIFNAGSLELDRVVVSGNKVEPAEAGGTSPKGGGVYSSGSLVIKQSRIEKNLSTSRPFNGGIPAGGGVFNDDGTLRIEDSQLLTNEAQTEVGGIPEGGGLGSEAAGAHGASDSVIRTLFQGNTAVGLGGTIPSGGAIATFNSDLTVRESTIVANKAISGTGGITQGGGLYATSGDLLLAESLVSGNVAESPTISDGGGVFALGGSGDSQSIVNTTIAGNQALAPSGGFGGGILHSSSAGAELQVLNTTIAGNSAVGTSSALGGNIYDSSGEKGTTVLRNSIVTAGTATEGANCQGSVKSAGHNIESTDECNFNAAGDRVNTDPLLGPLAGNGGPTQTMALLSGSPAIDAAGEPCPATDQRGTARPQGPACDIGAYEVFVPPSPTAATSGRATLRFLSKRARIDPKTGKGRLRARCLNVPGDVCAVKLRLVATAPKAGRAGAAKERRQKVGSLSGFIAGGKAAALRIKLNKRGRSLIAADPKRKLRVRAIGTSRNRAKEAVAVKAKLLFKLRPALRPQR